MRNRKTQTVPTFETVIDIDVKLEDFNITDFPVEVLAHIFSFCDIKTIGSLNQVNWLFFLIVASMNPKQFNLMNLYQHQIDSLKTHKKSLIFLAIHQDVQRFLELAQFEVPRLIHRAEEKKGTRDVSHLKIISFTSLFRTINQELSDYERIDEIEWGVEMRAQKALQILFKLGVGFGASFMLAVYTDSKILIGLALVGSFILFANNVYVSLESQNRHWNRRSELNNKLVQSFSMFEVNKSPGVLMNGVLENRNLTTR